MKQTWTGPILSMSLGLAEVKPCSISLFLHDHVRESGTNTGLAGSLPEDMEVFIALCRVLDQLTSYHFTASASVIRKTANVLSADVTSKFSLVPSLRFRTRLNLEDRSNWS